MLDRDQLETFASVAEQQSFERAATLLNVTRGAVSQRIKALEESLATILLLRDKPVTPTPAGEVLLRHVKALRLLEASSLRELLNPSVGEGPVPLAIAVNADSLATWFMPLLRDLFAQRAVALEVVTDDQDHTSGRLRRGEVVGCISTDAKAASGFVAEPLGAMEYRCYATPAFVAEFLGDGLTVANVLRAPAIHFNRKDALHAEFLQRRFGVRIDRYPRHYLPSPSALLEGIAMGAGYGLAPSTQAQRLLQEGVLQELAPGDPVHVDLFWHHWEMEPPIAREITDLIVGHAAKCLIQPRRPTGKPRRQRTLSPLPARRRAREVVIASM
ncbi:HTH-type transcriptional regulator ArgP [Ideonella azotifigens]|uniref:ArgP/LysG family DNA-binding transcriptional regulator n=2 Tax=Ideonella azotifigens TaxID=513160 RepID=A0ABP3UT48_9BURK|nr:MULTISPECIES: HTH-type transcriptional regulator ArgP [Ideonella]MCD2344720.1 HTH-type transcriptional regulator ArgP [Ideonella azotifigens]HSI51858.1 HTH-type transcriptional regulator ArgP [Ideonella sp.]